MNNAGVALPGPLEFLPVATLRQRLEVNLLGQPAAAAAAIARALTGPRPRPRSLVGRDALAASVIARLLYRLRYRLTTARR